MVRFIDNSVQERMINNRPPLSILPSVNKKLHLPRIAANAVLPAVVFSFLGVFTYQLITRTMSYQLYDTRKQFQFKSDPYSGTVSC